MVQEEVKSTKYDIFAHILCIFIGSRGRTNNVERKGPLTRERKCTTLLPVAVVQRVIVTISKE